MTTDHRNWAEKSVAFIPDPSKRDLATVLQGATHALLALDDTLRTILCWEEPPEEALARVKAETLEKAAQEGENAPLAGAGHDQAPSDPQPARSAPGPAQTLADLEPCLGDRVRVHDPFDERSDTYVFGWFEGKSPHDRLFAWCQERTHVFLDAECMWTVLEHLDPVTPEEPPVGSGMVVSARGYLFRRGELGWQERLSECWSLEGCWDGVLMDGPLRPATPADLARHGVGEDGEPVGKGEADDEQLTAACDWSDFRKDYGVSSDPELMQREHRAFLAGWQAGRHGDQSGVLR